MVILAEPNAVRTPDDLSEKVFYTRLAPRPSHDELEMVESLTEKLLPVPTSSAR